jgi:beta-glucanase (GH16 family)
MMTGMLRMRRTSAAAIVLAMLATLLFASQAAASANFSHRVFYQQFRHSLKAHTWTLYDGVPTCCKDSRWAPSHVVSKHGALRIQTYKDARYGGNWVSGGVSMARMVNQTYGRWVVRFRMKKGVGVGMDVALRPSGSGTVVDWIEESSDKGGARRIETATLHYGHTRVHARVRANFTKWHTMTLSWKPGRITVKLDGRRWANFRHNVPSAPMHMVMQTNTGTNGFSGVMPNSSTPRRVALQVDSVAVYRYR